MTVGTRIRRGLRPDWLNFLLTNRIPRRFVTLAMGRISRIRSPLFTAVGIAIWGRFCDLDLRDAKRSRFESLHDCFTRELKSGARSVVDDPSHFASPCDAIVGAVGVVDAGTVLQAKGASYRLAELLQDPALALTHEGGVYATLRLSAGMYHRFHAPHDCRIERVDYVSGDAWNVNPPALARIERLFCRNERAVIRCRLDGGELLTLVPVAAILVASIRLRFVDVRLHLRYRGPNRIPCDARLVKGEEMGWFENGSTIIVLGPPGVTLSRGTGDRIRMGESLMRFDGIRVPQRTDACTSAG